MPRDLPDDDDWIPARKLALGQRVQAERRHQNLTQEAVYLAANIDRRTLQAIEAGRNNARLETLLRIAYVLDVSLSDLVG